MIKKKLYIFLFLIVFASCYRVSENIEPQISYKQEEEFVKNLKPAFSQLTQEDRITEWGKECYIALCFAKQLDLYRAITTFKRSLILLADHNEYRSLEIQYNILLCYYLGKKYEDVIEYFEQSDLAHVDRSFSVFHDLLVVLYASYRHVGHEGKAQETLALIEKNFSVRAKKLQLSTALLSADIKNAQKLARNTEYEKDINLSVEVYEKVKKSIPKAQMLNAFIPGSGYFYVGQKKAAATSFLINGLFIAAAYHFFHKGQIAAGIITTSFEAGWYFGGIYGAGLEAKYYNERIYEKCETPLMNHYKLFPVFMINYGF